MTKEQKELRRTYKRLVHRMGGTNVMKDHHFHAFNDTNQVMYYDGSPVKLHSLGISGTSSGVEVCIHTNARMHGLTLSRDAFMASVVCDHNEAKRHQRAYIRMTLQAQELNTKLIDAWDQIAKYVEANKADLWRLHGRNITIQTDGTLRGKVGTIFGKMDVAPFFLIAAHIKPGA